MKKKNILIIEISLIIVIVVLLLWANWSNIAQNFERWRYREDYEYYEQVRSYMVDTHPEMKGLAFSVYDMEGMIQAIIKNNTNSHKFTFSINYNRVTYKDPVQLENLLNKIDLTKEYYDIEITYNIQNPNNTDITICNNFIE